ncbi:AraC family transcriptional regulator [Kaistia sp. 32K]|uniref:helix-turn-helix transcriptional regulator n=1 Tax=Kaistia sp. 32K TaxID=2795690 RepID=UPI0019152366|nr:helix-turn-helix transcriptional regulator [Kaistia sp. 32K]BCP56074.1 AraC family transcriptional regulator [Kaistia sp. 32K]
MSRSSKPEGAGQGPNIASALRPLAMHDTRSVVENGEPPILSAFVTRSRETIAQLVTQTAGLIIVIEGRKEIIEGVDHRHYAAGDAFVLPAGARVDVVNDPDSETGFYRALFISFPRELVIEAARLWPQFIGQEERAGKPVISADLCSAIVHCAEALSRRIAASRRVTDHRILEILLILAEQGILPLVPKYVDGSVVEAVRRLVRHRLHLPWTAASVAAELSMSEATLRRRLRAEAQSLQMLLRTERMRAAYVILADRDADVADALAATGYRSRSHFSRHFQESFGTSPSSVRHRKHAQAA